MTQREPHALPLGTMIGKHRLDMLLGRGGFGAVFAATDTTTGNRSALKILSARVLEQTGGVARFEREAELARRLSHPNTVRVLDSGSDAEGHRFIAFELLEGRSLEHALYDRGPIDPRSAARIALEVLAALDEAHAAGIVHRDIKPANIFLVRSEQGERVKVLDFGIAKSIRANTRVGLTQEGLTMGTPEYMAPEQISGGDVSPPTDLFSLGVVLAEMVVGRGLFPDHVQTSQLLMGRLMGQPLPPSPALAGSPLARVIAHATENDVARRIGDAQTFRRAILEVFPDLHDGAAAFSGLRLAPSRVGPSLVYQATEVTRDERIAGAARQPQATGSSWPTHAVGAPGAAMAPVTVESWGAPPPLQPLGPPGPYQVAVPVRGSSSSGSGMVILFVLVPVLLLVVGGAAGAAFYLSTASPAREKPARNDDDDDDEIADPLEDTDTQKPTSRSPKRSDVDAPGSTVAPPTLPPVPPAVTLREVSCARAASIRNESLSARLAPLGLKTTGQYLMCTGDMVNFRCMSTGGKGVIVSDDGRDGNVVALHFPSEAKALEFVASQKDGSSDATIARNGKDVLYLELAPASADRVVKSLCQ